MSMFDDKYFAYVSSSYGITFLVFIGLVIWIMVQHRGLKSKLVALEKQGITRRSDKSAKAQKNMSDQSNQGQSDNRNMRVILALIPLILFAGLAYIFLKQLDSGTNSSELPSPLLGKAAPQFSMPALEGLLRDGQQVPGLKTTDFDGKVTIVNVWASWCVPCRAEHPIIVKLGEDKRLRLVGINYKDKPGNALRFLGQLGNPFEAVGTDQKGRAAIDWGVYGIPETFVIGRDATIRYKHVGPLDPVSLKKLQAEIDKAVAG